MKVRELLHALSVANPELDVLVSVDYSPRESYVDARYAGVDDLMISTGQRTLRGEHFVIETKRTN